MNRPHDTASVAALRAAATVLLVWAFGVLGVVGAVHSVHHLLDEHGGDGDHCLVASVAQHVHSNSVDLPRIALPVLGSEPSAPSTSGALRSLPTFRPDEGRAPPRIPSS